MPKLENVELQTFTKKLFSNGQNFLYFFIKDLIRFNQLENFNFYYVKQL
jgi:hypothetical protein